MTRTPNTEGTVRESPQGSGWYRAMLPARLSPTGQRKYLEGRWRTKTEARRQLRTAISDIEHGRMTTPSGIRGQAPRRVRDAVADYIEHRESSPTAPLAVKTARGYRSDLKNHIKSPNSALGNTRLDRLTPAVVHQWMDDLARAGVKPGTAETAKRLLNAALNREVAAGRLPNNPATLVRKESSKAARAAGQKPDVVLLPSWSEFASLVTSPERQEDRILIALLGWVGLRWSEAISLEATALWRERPVMTVSRVLTKRTEKEMAAGKAPWEVEATKSGLTATVPIPGPFWRRLVLLADQRSSEPALPAPAGHLLFRPAEVRVNGTNSIGTIDNSNFNRDVWSPARAAAGLAGDETLPVLDPRRDPVKVKDLRAFAASVLLDAGSSLTEAAALLRHSDSKTTERHYARAMHDKAYDAARRVVSIDKSLSLQERLDALWGAWIDQFPDVEQALGLPEEDSSNRHLGVLNGCPM